jgi:hypothetical protein
VARVAAVGLVAAGACLLAVHVVPAPASADVASALPDVGAAKLVVIPQFTESGAEQTAISATITDRAEITRVAEIVNTLPPAPTGIFNCPIDIGGGLDLDFETADGAVIKQVSLHATGCGGTSIVINGEQQPRRASDRSTIQQIQSVLGTNWQIIRPLPG